MLTIASSFERLLPCGACAFLLATSLASSAVLPDGTALDARSDVLRAMGLRFEETVTPGALRSLNTRGRAASPSFNSFATRAFATSTSSVNMRVTGVPDGEEVQVQNDPSAAVSGRTAVVSYDDERLVTEAGGYPSAYTGYAVSFDGGATFDQRFVPAPPDGATLGVSRTISAPDDRFLLATLADFSVAGNHVEGLGVAAFGSGSAGFDAPEPVALDLSGNGILIDSPAIAADASTESPWRGAVYVSFTRLNLSDPGASYSVVYVAASSDGGKTFDAAVPVSLPRNREFVQFSSLAVAPDGAVRCAYLAYGRRDRRPDRITKDAIRIARSTDGGRTFGVPKTVAEFFRVTNVTDGSANYSFEAGGGVHAYSIPTVVSGADGAVHIVFPAAPELAGPDPSDVMYAYSKDGANFSAPIRVNQDVGATAQFEPSLALALDGSVGIGWLDRRNDPERGVLTDAYFGVGRSGGPFPNVVASDASWRFGEAQAFSSDHGLISAATKDGDGFLFAWTDERNGSGDVFAQHVSSSGLAHPNVAVADRSALPRVTAGTSAEIPLDLVAGGDAAAIFAVRATTEDPRLSVTVDGPSGTDSLYSLRVAALADAATGPAEIEVAVDVDGWTHTTPIRVAVLDVATPEPRTLVEGTGSVRAFDGVVIDGFGTMHVFYTDDSHVWSDNTGRSNLYYASMRDGVTFTTPIRLVGARVSVNDVDAAVTADGTIYVTWTEYSDGRLQLWARYAVSTDGGRTFSRPHRLVEDRGQLTLLSRVVLGPDGAAAFVYTRTVPGRRDLTVVAARRYLGGGELSEEVRVSREGEDVTDRVLRAATGADGFTYVVYLGKLASSPREMVCASLDATLHNVAFATVAKRTAEDFASDPEIAVDAKGRVYVSVRRAYVDDDSEETRRELSLLRSDSGQNFARVGAVPGSPTSAAVTSLVFGGDGRLYATWTDANPTHLYYGSDCLVASSTDFGATFSAPRRLSFHVGQTLEPTLAVSGSRRFAAWASDASGRLAVYASELP